MLLKKDTSCMLFFKRHTSMHGKNSKHYAESPKIITYEDKIWTYICELSTAIVALLFTQSESFLGGFCFLNKTLNKQIVYWTIYTNNVGQNALQQGNLKNELNFYTQCKAAKIRLICSLIMVMVRSWFAEFCL